MNTDYSQRTVVLLTRENQVLLGYKKTGFGKGKFLGIGGKVEPGETVEKAAKRELKEEVGITQPGLEVVGELRFLFPEKPSWSQQVHIFVSATWQGEPVESEEIRPAWFDSTKLPFDKMWDDAQYWFERVLMGEKVKGEFVFDSNLLVQAHKLDSY